MYSPPSVWGDQAMGTCIGLEKDNEEPPNIEMTCSSSCARENKMLVLTVLFFPFRKKAWKWKHNNHNFQKRIIFHNKRLAQWDYEEERKKQKPQGDRWPWGKGGKESPSCPLPPHRFCVSHCVTQCKGPWVTSPSSESKSLDKISTELT